MVERLIVAQEKRVQFSSSTPLWGSDGVGEPWQTVNLFSMSE